MTYVVVVFLSIYIPRALNTGTCMQQSDLFYSAGLYRNRCEPQLTQENVGRGFGKMQVNGQRVKIIKEEIPASKSSMYGYIRTYSRL